MKSYPSVTYDATVDAVAVTLAPAPKGSRPVTRELAPGIRADFAGAQLLGLEILDASAMWSARVLATFVPPVTWLTMDEAMAKSKRERSTLKAAIATGRMPGARKVGRDWLIPEHELWNYLESLAPQGRPPKHRRAPARKRRGAAV